MKTIGIFIMATLIFQFSFSQQQSAHQKTTPKFSVDYTTNNVYLGRRDSLHVPYIKSSLRFTTPSGFFA